MNCSCFPYPIQRSLLCFVLFFISLSSSPQGILLKCSSNKSVYQKGEPIVLQVEMSNISATRYIVVANFFDVRSDFTPKDWNGNWENLPGNAFFDNQVFTTPFGMMYSGKVKYDYSAVHFPEHVYSSIFCYYSANLMCLMPGMKIGEKIILNNGDGRGEYSYIRLQEGKHKIRFRYWVKGTAKTFLRNYTSALHNFLRIQFVPQGQILDTEIYSNTIEIEVLNDSSDSR